MDKSNTMIQADFMMQLSSVKKRFHIWRAELWEGAQFHVTAM
jgi:hypothetical protein